MVRVLWLCCVAIYCMYLKCKVFLQEVLLRPITSHDDERRYQHCDDLQLYHVVRPQHRAVNTLILVIKQFL
jgi:hypothetical protein